MSCRIAGFSLLIVIWTTQPGRGQEPWQPPGDNKPLVRLEAGGPTSNVTALALSPNGDTLYAAGFDKVVRIWRRKPAPVGFELDEKTYFRVPINPGTEGAINALALSPDGKWLAVGGLGVVRVAAGFDEVGRVWPAPGLKPEHRADQGLIYVFATQHQEVRLLRGHRGPILSLIFAPGKGEQPPPLISAAESWNAKTGKAAGEVRVWDVGGEKPLLGELTGLPPKVRGGRTPGLAVISTGMAPNELRVAIAWGDAHQGADQKPRGFLRLWDVDAPDGSPKDLEDGANNTAVAAAPDGTSVVTGSFLKRRGQLQAWNLAGQPAKAGKPVDLGAEHLYPDAFALFALADKTADHAALLLTQLHKDREENRLRIVDLRPGKFGQTRVDLALWDNDTKNPQGTVVAASAGGQYLAVAGNLDHTIKVYAIADLLKDKIKPQVLHSVGATMRTLAFATRQEKGKARLGLVMGESADLQMVFDFAQRSLTNEIKPWTVAGPAPNDWKVINSDRSERPVSLYVFNNNKLVKSITLPAEQRLDAVAVLPPQPFLQEPLLVVAAYEPENGLPVLEVYLAKTGKRLRRYIGHTAPVNALAISPDGKLLASAANDQTIAVWKLTDLTEVYEKSGSLPGVVVEELGKDLVVTKVEKDSKAKGQLFKNDVITAVVAKKERPLKTTYDFYDAFWVAKPRSKVVLRVRDREADVSLVVDQGIDARKPLFSLFVTRPGAGGAREWLGWNALGLYDASNDAVKRYLGWHFNTGQIKEPTKFAFIDQYGEDFYKKDLLNDLVEKGFVPPPIIQGGVAPTIQFGDPVNAALTANGEWLVRRPSLTLPIRNLQPALADVPEGLIDGKGAAMERLEGDLWSIPLPGESGRYKVFAKVSLKDREKKTVEQTWSVRYQPPAPEIEHQAPLFEESADEVYTFKAKVSAAGPGPSYQVTLWFNEKLLKTWKPTKREEQLEIKQELTLKAGDNLIRVEAKNDQALKDFADEERQELNVKIAYKTLSIALEQIESRDAGEGPWQIKPKQKIVVTVPRVRLVGAFKTPEKIGSAEWDLGGKPEQVGQLRQGPKETAFAQDLELEPGKPTTVRIVAKTVKGREGTETVTLFYRPALPKVVLGTQPPILEIAPDKDEASITVEGELKQPRIPSLKPYPLQATIWRNGKVLGPPMPLMSNDKALPKTNVTLEPGPNDIKVQLTHAWDSEPSTDEFALPLVRPPVIKAMTATRRPKSPFMDLRIDVVSPHKPLEDSIVVKVNGVAQNFPKPKVTGDNKTREWTVEVIEVPLSEEINIKKHVIAVVVGNAEALSKSYEGMEVAQGQNLVAPEIILVKPGIIGPLETPTLDLVFRVKSPKPLLRVEVTQGKLLHYRALPAELKPNDAGHYEFAKTLALNWGENHLQVEAVNEDAPTTKPLTFTVPLPPVQLSLLLLSLEKNKGKPYPAEVTPSGKVLFREVPSGQVYLHGKVRWSSPNEVTFKQEHQVRFYVNGFQQVPVSLGPPVGLERFFEAKLLLNLPKDRLNHIEVFLPTIPQEGSNRLEGEVACANPIRRQHLHFVLVAPGFEEDKGLKDRIANALKAERVGPDRYKSPIFDAVHIYPMTGHVRWSAVNTRLKDEIFDSLLNRARDGSPNDVVMIYFLGKETVHGGRRFLWTSDTQDGGLRGPLKALAVDDLLAKDFARFPGAQVLFLDLGSQLPLSDNSAAYRLALFRHLQLKPKTQPALQLFKALEDGMPKATWLDDLPPILSASLNNFAPYYPKSLKMRLNPDAAGPK